MRREALLIIQKYLYGKCIFLPKTTNYLFGKKSYVEAKGGLLNEIYIIFSTCSH